MDNRYGKLLNTCLCFRPKEQLGLDYVRLVAGIDEFRKRLIEYHKNHSDEVKDKSYCVALSIDQTLKWFQECVSNDDLSTTSGIMEVVYEKELQRDSKKSD